MQSKKFDEIQQELSKGLLSSNPRNISLQELLFERYKETIIKTLRSTQSKCGSEEVNAILEIVFISKADIVSKKELIKKLIEYIGTNSQHIDKNKIIETIEVFQQERLAAYILEQFIHSVPLSASQLNKILKISMKFSSNEFKAQVLIECIDSYDLNTEDIDTILAITDGFQQGDADAFKAEVFIALINSENLDLTQIERLRTTAESFAEPFRSNILDTYNVFQELDSESYLSQNLTWITSTSSTQNIKGWHH